MPSLRRVVRLLPFVVIVAMVLVAPHVKVEESFNAQLMHDALFGGGRLVPVQANDSPIQGSTSVGKSTAKPPKWIRGGLRSFDHHSFPGVVPRTTLGALAVAAVAQPVVRSLEQLDDAFPFAGFRWFGRDTRADALLVCRLVLGIAFGLSLLFLADGVTLAVSKRGAPLSPALHDAGCWLLLLESFAMYHLMNSASRPFPNTFAALLVNVAVGYVLREGSARAIALLATAAVVFRSDVAVFAAPLCLALLLSGRVNFFKGVAVGISSALLALVTSAAVDSVLWGRPLWPEGVVFYYNTVLNKSHEWGVMSWHWYFSSALPRSMLIVLPLSLLALAAPRRCGVPNLVRLLGISAFTFVGLYSCLPHKEVRFILMALPTLAAPAACLMAAAWTKRGLFVRLVLFLAVVGCGGLSAFLHYANSKVYAGAKALQVVHADIDATWAKLPLEDGEPWRLRVYLDAYACMNGITRFDKRLPTSKVVVTYSKDPTVFNKTWFESRPSATPPGCGDESPASFDYLIVRQEDEAWHLARCGESAVPLKKIADVKMWVPQIQLEWPPVKFRKPKFLSVLKTNLG